MTFESNGNTGAVDESHGLIALAQKIYEERVAEGELKRSQLIAEGESLLTESQNKADSIIADSERENADIVERLKELRQVELDFRQSVRDLIAEAEDNLDALIRDHDEQINGVPEEALSGVYSDEDHQDDRDDIQEVSDMSESGEENSYPPDQVDDVNSEMDNSDNSGIHESVGIADEDGRITEVESADENESDDDVRSFSEEEIINDDMVNDEESNSPYSVPQSDFTVNDETDSDWMESTEVSSDWSDDNMESEKPLSPTDESADDRNHDVDGAAERSWNNWNAQTNNDSEISETQESEESEPVSDETSFTPVIDEGETTEEESNDTPDKFSFFKDPSERGRISSPDDDEEAEKASWMS